MKLTYTLHARLHTPKDEKERHVAKLKRKHGCRAILRAIEALDAQPATSVETGVKGNPTVSQTGVQL